MTLLRQKEHEFSCSISLNTKIIFESFILSHAREQLSKIYSIDYH
jgi:hypothetical protein